MNKYQALYGIFFMLINTLSLAGLDIAAKILRADLNAVLIVFLYKFSLLIIILPWVLKEGLVRLKTKKIVFHILRSTLGTAGALLFFHGLRFINMADAAALENIQYILIVMIGALMFKEDISKTKIAAVITGFIGAIIVANPRFFGELLNISDAVAVFNPNYIFIFLAICLWSCNTIIVKLLGNTEHNKTQMFYLLLFSSIISFPAVFIKFEDISILHYSVPLIPNFVSPSNINISMTNIAFLAIMSVCYFIHGVAYFNALKSELSIVIPFRYTKLIFSGILGYIVFNETENTISYIGYTLIIISSFLLLRKQWSKINKSTA